MRSRKTKKPEEEVDLKPAKDEEDQVEQVNKVALDEEAPSAESRTEIPVKASPVNLLESEINKGEETTTNQEEKKTRPGTFKIDLNYCLCDMQTEDMRLKDWLAGWLAGWLTD